MGSILASALVRTFILSPFLHYIEDISSWCYANLVRGRSPSSVAPRTIVLHTPSSLLFVVCNRISTGHKACPFVIIAPLVHTLGRGPAGTIIYLNLASLVLEV